MLQHNILNNRSRECSSVTPPRKRPNLNIITSESPARNEISSMITTQSVLEMIHLETCKVADILMACKREKITEQYSTFSSEDLIMMTSWMGWSLYNSENLVQTYELLYYINEILYLPLAQQHFASLYFIKEKLNQLYIKIVNFRLLVLKIYWQIIQFLGVDFENSLSVISAVMINFSSTSEEWKYYQALKNYVYLLKNCVQYEIESGSVQALLSTGSFGLVYQIEIEGKLSALKRAKNIGVNNFSFLHEMALHSTFDHKNIIGLYGVCLKEDNLSFLLEFALYGSLRKVLVQTTQISLSQSISFLFDIAQGLAYMHGLSIMHGDIKPENILIDENYNAKISDFGCAVNLDHDLRGLIVSGTKAYFAPEVLDGTLKFSLQRDIFALYKVWQQMMGGGKCECFDAHFVQYSSSEKENVDVNTELLTNPVTLFMTQCGASFYRKRPSAEVIVNFLATQQTFLV